MPELPEVETIYRRVNTLLLGKKITQVSVLRAKSFQGDSKLLEGAVITQLSRRGKILQLSLDTSQHILIHLKMTGQLLFEDFHGRVGGGHPTADFLAPLPSRHTRVVVTFSDKSVLYFNDMRVFGWVRVVADDELLAQYSGLAPDIIDPKFTFEQFFASCSTRSTPIKQVIMDNSVVAGVGNIYACDALSLARIDPRRPARLLSKQEALEVFDAMRTVIQLGIQYGGATIHSFVSVDGVTGRYQDVRRVYQRVGEPCPNCAAVIVKIQLAGRGTFLCEQCQR
jgi:formamidopyrimidine-DNA glycosylase